MSKYGPLLLFAWTSALVVNAAEPTLGDKRLFFSGQERQAMAIADKGLGFEGSTPRASHEIRPDRPASSVSKNTPSSAHPLDRLADWPSALFINGFVEASGFLTLFVNGKPCESVPIAIEIPQGIDCNQLMEPLLPTLSLERVDEFQFMIKKSDGKVIVLDR